MSDIMTVPQALEALRSVGQWRRALDTVDRVLTAAHAAEGQRAEREDAAARALAAAEAAKALQAEAEARAQAAQAEAETIIAAAAETVAKAQADANAEIDQAKRDAGLASAHAAEKARLEMEELAGKIAAAQAQQREAEDAAASAERKLADAQKRLDAIKAKLES